MKRNQSAIASAIGLALSGASLSAEAVLTTTTTLAFGGSYGGNSYFATWLSPTNSAITTSVSSYQGIQIGVLQPASGSHGGQPNGSESPSIDNPWYFFYNTGMFMTTGTPITVLSHSGQTAMLDMSGYGLIWDWPSYQHVGDPTNFAADTNIATLVCSQASCSTTSSFVLDYSGHLPAGGSTFGGVQFDVHYEGCIPSLEESCTFTPFTVAEVPIPPTVWLMGAGLAGLAGVARRRTQNKRP